MQSLYVRFKFSDPLTASLGQCEVAFGKHFVTHLNNPSKYHAKLQAVILSDMNTQYVGKSYSEQVDRGWTLQAK